MVAVASMKIFRVQIAIRRQEVNYIYIFNFFFFFFFLKSEPKSRDFGLTCISSRHNIE
jgi:hypothetical protein